MKLKKVKILATICSLAMAFAMLGFATFAAFSTEGTFSGTITAKSVNAKYDLTIEIEADGGNTSDYAGETLFDGTVEENGEISIDTPDDIELEYGDEISFVFTFTNSAIYEFITIVLTDFTFDLEDDTYISITSSNAPSSEEVIDQSDSLVITVTLKYADIDSDNINADEDPTTTFDVSFTVVADIAAD